MFENEKAIKIEENEMDEDDDEENKLPKTSKNGQKNQKKISWKKNSVTWLK